MKRLEEHSGHRANPETTYYGVRSWSLAVAVSALALLLNVAPVGASSTMAGLVMRNGKVLTMIDGKPAVPIPAEATMSNGTRVEPDGTVKPKDGPESRLGEGDIIMMDGHIMRGGKPKAMQP